MKINKILITFLVLSVTSHIAAQTGTPTVSADDQSREEAFIDAQRDIYIGRTDKALEKLEAMFKTDRTDAAVSYELAKLYAAKKDLLQFERYATAMAANAPKNIAMLEYATKVYVENSKYSLAEKGFLDLILLSPSNKEYFTKLAKLFLQQGKTAETIALLSKQDLKFGKSYDVSRLRYEIYLGTKDYDKMLVELNYLISKHPSDKNLHKDLASYYLSIGIPDKANKEYKKVLEIDPEDVEANLAILAKGPSKDMPSAYLMSLVPLISNTSMDIDPKIKELTPYIKNLANGGNEEVSRILEELIHKLVQAHPTDAKAYALAGDVLMLNEKTEEAIVRYEKTLTLNNKVFAVWEQLMYGYLEQNRYGDLYKTAVKAIDYYPNESINFFFASIGASAKNLHGDAFDLAEEGLVVSGGNLAATVRLKTAAARALLGQNKVAAALSNIEEAIQKSNSKYAYAYEVLGNIYEAKSELSKAKDAWKKSIELGNRNKALLTKVL